VNRKLINNNCDDQTQAALLITGQSSAWY